MSKNLTRRETIRTDRERMLSEGERPARAHRRTPNSSFRVK